MREMDLDIKLKKARGCGTDSRHGYRRYRNLIKCLKPQRPNQVWVADITYVRVGSRFAYLALIMDVFTRSVRSWHLSRFSGQDLTLDGAAKRHWTGIRRRRFITPTKAGSTPPKPMSNCCAITARKSAWPPKASQAKTAMSSG